jgi:hypothetical protein
VLISPPWIHTVAARDRLHFLPTKLKHLNTYTGAWGLWRVMILQQKAKERRTLELWSVRIIQRVFRGHR